MATGIITIIASILSLVAGWFFKDEIAKLFQAWADYENKKLSDTERLKAQLMAQNLNKEYDDLLKHENDIQTPVQK